MSTSWKLLLSSTAINTYVLSVCLFIVRRWFINGSKLPPGSRLPLGPPGTDSLAKEPVFRKPLIGNLLDIPPKHSWLKFKQWADQYGPIFRLNIAGRNHYVVSTEKIANDLLRSRGMIYSGREQLPSAAVLLSDTLRPLFLPHGELWRRGRKLMHHLTMPSAATSYQPSQILESARLMHNLIREPERYDEWLELYSSGIIFRLAFGETIESDDKGLKRIQNVVHTVERVASPGAYLVDTFPSLMYLPTALAPFKRELKKLHGIELNLFRELLNKVRKRMKDGKAPPCWERSFIEEKEKLGLSDDEGAYVIGTLYEAGSSTTAAAMMNVVLALVHYPAWQTRLQEEVDQVVGDSRMPVFEDIERLPVVRAVAKEALRWRPVSAGGIPHQLDKDDVYDGIFFPKGTNVHANQWAIHREEALYPDPETFNPDRWLNPAYPTYREPLSVHPSLQGFSAFGFGRRICPGLNIAERSLNILTARIAWACHISKQNQANGKAIHVPWYNYTTGFNVQPHWFPFELEPRKGRDQIVEKEWLEEKANDPLSTVNKSLYEEGV